MLAQDRKPFKTCAMCSTHWKSNRDLIEDRDLRLNGYIADFDDPGEGLILFTHLKDGCGSTIGVKAEKFASLFQGKKYSSSKTGSPTCRGKCNNIEDFSLCNQECGMVWVRELLNSIKMHFCPGCESTRMSLD
jgi:hypothetical protein